MGRSLVIVESPAKARTINRYLGDEYVVKASFGHIMDLPKNRLGVDIDRGFEPTYEVIPGKEKVIKALRSAARTAEAIYLAADPDREGEAICAHLAEVLRDGKTNRRTGKKIHRVLFNEITSKAIREAFEKPTSIDSHLVDAQQARRILDRLVGYEISPLLWDKVKRGLSAGRVQTVALRLVVEREREIRAFVAREYWTILASLEAGEPPAFEAKLLKRDGENLEIPDEATAKQIVEELAAQPFIVQSVEQKEKRRWPVPPFTTSKLQQEAARKLHFTVKRTMMLAQRLYEGKDLGEKGSIGLITYMRTDSVRVSEGALAEAREYIGEAFGANYLPESAIHYKSQKDAQDAHEAIRPTSVALTPESIKPYLEEDEYKLYRLVWQRFVASQMVPAVFDQTVIEIAAGPYRLRTTGSVPKFDGFLAVYEEGKDEKDTEEEEARSRLPQVSEGELLKLAELKPEQHFTEPPPRYTEATLVKELEEKGIGRPSTYATILSTIVERDYVRREKGRFFPTELGELVAGLLVKSFEDIFEVAYTARMEEELDEIEQGKLGWQQALKEFYERFEKDLDKASDLMEDYKAGVPTEIMCERCGRPMLKRMGRHGLFLGCSGYPECENTRELTSEVSSEEVESETTPEVCENCGREMVPKRGRFGPFLACSGYPECKTTKRLNGAGQPARKPDVPLGETCPSCGGELVLRHGRYGEFIACSNYPTCKYTRQKTLGIPCPKEACSGELVERVWRRGRAHSVFYGCSRYPECDFRTSHKPVAQPCPQCGSALLLEKTTKKEGTVRYCWKESCSYQTVPA